MASKMLKELNVIRESMSNAYDKLTLTKNFDEKDVQDKKPLFMKQVVNWLVRRIQTPKDWSGLSLKMDDGVISAKTEKFGTIVSIELKKSKFKMLVVKQQKKELERVVADRKKKNEETCFTFNVALDTPMWLNNESITSDMKRWRIQKKEGVLTIKERNNREYEINGKKWYTMVIQDTVEKNNRIDPLAVGVGFIVSGMVYWFKSEENRNTAVSYIMK